MLSACNVGRGDLGWGVTELCGHDNRRKHKETFPSPRGSGRETFPSQWGKAKETFPIIFIWFGFHSFLMPTRQVTDAKVE